MLKMYTMQLYMYNLSFDDHVTKIIQSCDYDIRMGDVSLTLTLTIP